MRRKKKFRDRDANEPIAETRTALAMSGVAVLAVVLITAVTFTYYQQFNLTGPYRRNYEGRIVDKSLTIRESQYGSWAVRRLRVRGKGGEEFEVSVSDALYQRAQVGMWIKRSDTGVKVLWQEPDPSPTAVETKR